METTFSLSDDMLGRIDAIVSPGTNLYEPDRATPHTLKDASTRRQRNEERRPV